MSPWIININLTFIQKALKLSILFAEASLSKIGKECKSYMKVCMLQEIWADIQELLSHSAFWNLQIFSINSEGLGNEEKLLHGRGDIKRFWEEMGWEFAGYGIYY